jgi:hypothetical protein
MDQPDVTETERLSRLYGRRVAQRGSNAAATHVSPEAIVALLQRDGGEEDRLATLEHVMSCAPCHREYEWLKAVDEAATTAGARDQRGSAWWRRTPLALAASLVAAAGVALLVQDRLRSGSETTRGGSGDIALLAPAPTGPAAGPLTFVWRPVPGASGYVLEIQREDRSIAYSDTTRDTVLTLAEPGRLLPPAEYRWWVRELTDGAEPRSSSLRELRLTHR